MAKSKAEIDNADKSDTLSTSSRKNPKLSLVCDCDFAKIYDSISEGVKQIVETCITPDEEYLGMDIPSTEPTEYCNWESWRPSRQCCYLCHHNVCQSHEEENDEQSASDESDDKTEDFDDEIFKLGARVVTYKSLDSDGKPHRGTVRQPCRPDSLLTGWPPNLWLQGPS